MQSYTLQRVDLRLPKNKHTAGLSPIVLDKGDFTFFILKAVMCHFCLFIATFAWNIKLQLFKSPEILKTDPTARMKWKYWLKEMHLKKIFIHFLVERPHALIH